MQYEELEPKKFYYYFKKLSDIPRGSGNEAAATKFVYDTATSLGHKAVVDCGGNVLVTASATPGYEDKEPLLLQGHLDMVCEANSGVMHDFTKDPIKLILDGDTLTADGTTLGADNGVAVAMMLAILDSELPHPTLECLFTTEEEIGLVGIQKFDAKSLKSKRMINIDSAEEGVAIASCSGGVRSIIEFPFESENIPQNYSICRISINGLFGGHSGEDIHRGRIGAIYAGARILHEASKVCDIRIISADGGNRTNAIPREFTAVLAVSDYNKFVETSYAESEKIKAELVSDDMGFSFSISSATAKKCVAQKRSNDLIQLLRVLPGGVISMSRQIEGLVESSSNLAVIATNDNSLTISTSSRSSVSSKLDNIQGIIESASSLAGASVEHINRYPAWDFISDSPLQRLYLQSYRTVFGKDAVINGIHAGLECAYIKDQIPDMDIISVGPDLKNLHSPDESMSVSSMARLWDLMCHILKNA